MAAAPLSVDGKPVDVREFFNLLESNESQTVQDIQHLIQDNLASTKEAWLVHSLVDYYYISHSSTTETILTEVREPHDKHLVEKLNEGVKSVEHRLYAMKLVLAIVCKQPIWIHKIITQPVFGTIIKCLKSETDVPVLVTGLTTITILLPSVPSLMNQHLAEIFEIFSRLTGFNAKKPGNVPDVFLLYLQVALYSLFHRLYGMYPSNFLTYLKNYYCKKENTPVYEECVKPMLERVRLHPQLITGNREYEISSKRWKQMEVQDVLIECCRMSLDPVEGAWEETHCPVLPPHYKLYKSFINKETNSSLPGTPSKDSKTFNQTFPLSEQSPLTSTSTIDTSVLCSPSMVIGLSTPPPSQRNTPATSFLETSASFQPSVSGTYGNTPLMTPPVNTPRATPPVTDDSDKGRASSRGSFPKGQDPKRQSTGSVLSGKSLPSLVMPTVNNPSSVPPSPLKTEFTALPPSGTMKSLPVRQTTARELCFDAISESHSSTTVVTSSTPDFTSSTPVVTQDKTCSNIDVSTETLKNDNKTLETVASSNTEQGVQDTELMGSDSFSVYSLPHVMEGLETNVTDTTDQEVSEITQNDHDPEVTAESVAQFMKSVNRIRFNSLTATNNVEKLLGEKKFTHKLRSRSCPHLPKLMSPELEVEEPEHLSRSISSTFRRTFEPMEEEDFEEDVDTENVMLSLSDGATVSYSTTNTKKVTTVKSNGCDSLTANSTASMSVTTCPVYSPGSVREDIDGHDIVTDLFKTLMLPTLFPASVQMCQKCGSQVVTNNNKQHKGNQVPIFNTYSPPELLDKHIQLGGEIHAKELSKIPMTSQDTINWTHFGGMPPADEINILRGQIFMIQNQLMYERHKRELHSKRNRRLLRKIVNAQALEEQNSAMKDQLNLQESEIQNLQVSLKLLQEENRRFKETTDSNEYQKLCELRTCMQENVDLKSAKTELNTLLVRQREEQDLLKKDLQTTQAKLFEAEKEIDHLTEQVAISQKLKEQVLQLHKELLLMGELQQKYQEKLQATKLGHNSKCEQDYLIATLKAEVKVLKAQQEHQKVQLEASQARTEELEELSKVREIAFTELKHSMDNVKSSHDDEIKALEEKYQNSVKINQQLESKILHLYSKVDQLGIPKQAFSLVKEESPSRERTGSDPTLQAKQQKKPLTKLSSVPLHCNMDPEQEHQNISEEPASYGHSYTQEEIESDILDREGTNAGASSHQNEADSASISSRESGMFHYPSRTSTLSYSEGEDRSSSSKGSHLIDSGYSA